MRKRRVITMPGPGGGSHGGGGFGGSHGGGGFGGGSHGGGGFGGGSPGGFGGGFGGGPRRPHGHYGPRFYYGPRFFWSPWRRPVYYGGGGGGCLGGLLGSIFFIIAIVLVIFVLNAVFLFGSTSPGGTAPVGENGLIYDENTLQDFADGQYAEEFRKSSAYEDNLLIVFLTNEDYDGYTYIAWVGDHIDQEINYLFGNENTAFGRTVNSEINTKSFKYSLDTNLAAVMNKMKDYVLALELPSSFSCKEERSGVRSHVKNLTGASLTVETLETALADFTEATGIPVVIVIEDEGDVFESYSESNPQAAKPKISGDFVKIALVVIVTVVIVVLIIKSSKKSKGEDKESKKSASGKDYGKWD